MRGRHHSSFASGTALACIDMTRMSFIAAVSSMPTVQEKMQYRAKEQQYERQNSEYVSSMLG